METQEKQKLTEELKKAKSIALFLGENFQESDVLAREALGASFRLNGIPVYFFPETPASSREKWSSVLPPQQKDEFIYHTLIHIPKQIFTTKEISYENNEKFLTINVGTYDGHIKKKEVFFEAKPTEIDFTFFFGNGEIKNSDILIKKEKSISFGESGCSTTENVSKIIQATKIKPITNTLIPTLLYTSLLSETKNLNENTKPDLFILAGNLLKLGADKKKTNNLVGKKPPIPFPQLLGRALARTQENKELKSTWTFISKKDLEKTNNLLAGKNLFQQLLSFLKDCLPFYPIGIIFWQNQKDEIWGILSPRENQKEFFSKIALLMPGEKTEEFYLVGPFLNFSRAEIKTQEALREIS